MSRPERHQQIILLARTLTDYDYQPKTATGAAIQSNTKAEAHEGNEETILCRDCKGEGKRRIRTVLQVCETCRGSGVEVVDQYTGRRLMTETQEAERTTQRMVRCDECGGSRAGKWWRNGAQLTNVCRRCRGHGVVPGPERTLRPFRGSAGPVLSAIASDLGRGDPVLACMERRELAGSYNELGLALACLRLQHRPLYVLHVEVFVEARAEEEELSGHQLFLLEQSLRYLDDLMPAEIRVPSWAARYEERRREQVASEAA